MSKVKILKDESVEMMKIVLDEKVLFEGNYWDFNRDPDGLLKFLKKLNLNVSIEKYNYK
jgi:hypothetical protein